MKISLLNSNVAVALGAPVVETFELTPKSFRAWLAANRALGGISANEVWNEQQGLPCPAARAWLKRLHADRFGICDGKLTWKDVQDEVSAS